ncbi:MAG TPA: lipid-A-disaccharide synthase [Pyrinomonadaceae bacterium]|nr:lipid-A-disaccharide synthase [Pyrinomonadaceae bacterium]
MTPNPNNLRLMIVAGEPSGDAHAAALVQALRADAPDTVFEFFGAAGPQMREAGVEPIVRADDLAIIGIVEVARVFSRFWKAFGKLKRAAAKRQPHAAILVDWPEFNLRLAKAFHRRGIRVIYYISPQLWAWRSYRIRSMRRNIDLMLSILPFEVEWFGRRGMRQVEYVGNPLAGKVQARYGREEFCRLNDLDPARPIVALLPGSRHNELTHILPPMLDAACVIAQDHPEVQFALVVAPGRAPDEVKQIANHRAGASLPATLRIIEHQTREALASANAAAIASGTATLEAGLLGTPMVIGYRDSTLNWHTLGRLTHPDHYGLPNLLAGRRMMTELIQNDLNGKRLAAEILSLLDAKRNQDLRAQLREVQQVLGEDDASRRAAERVLAALSKWK